MLCFVFPLLAGFGEEAGAGWAIFGEGFVVAVAVEADGGGADEGGGWWGGVFDGVDELSGGVDAGGADDFFELRGPRGAGDGFSGEVEDGVCGGEGVAPFGVLFGAPWEAGDAFGECGAGFFGVACECDDLMALLEELVAEGPADEAGGSGDQDFHGCGFPVFLVLCRV
ncbi:MAG: hypothetical protein RMJ43_03855 [Chloroherpetonaceae bacterium]|nr:hypothetical protein [Chloroherpetonaceae bacterium]